MSGSLTLPSLAYVLEVGLLLAAGAAIASRGICPTSLRVNPCSIPRSVSSYEDSA